MLLDFEALHLCWQQWVLISSSSSQQEATSSNLHHPPQNLGSVMTAQPSQLGPVIHYKLFPAGRGVQSKVRTELIHYKHSPWFGLLSYYKVVSFLELHKQMTMSVQRGQPHTGMGTPENCDRHWYNKTIKFFIDLHQPEEFSLVMASYCLKKMPPEKYKEGKLKKVIL